MAQVYCRQSCSCSGAHAHDPIGQAFERFEHRVEPGFAVGVEHLHEVKPHRFGDERERADVKGELEPAGSVHRQSLKFFRINHRDEQIGEQREGNEADNDVFHKLIQSFPHQWA